MKTIFVLVELYKRETILAASDSIACLQNRVPLVWLTGDFWASPRDGIISHTKIDRLPRYEIREIEYCD